MDTLSLQANHAAKLSDLITRLRSESDAYKRWHVEQQNAATEEHEITFRERPLGFAFWANVHGTGAKVVRITEKHTQELGVQPGWELYKILDEMYRGSLTSRYSGF